ncbi:hypothetical protein E2I00_004007 [Balaenoptera physalus]|uniref:Hyaluronan synthase 2 n=1 Tax=Balaenoptera physalus TaxID=9770 RepID=A0A6A1Q8Q3_BALPH|nr:hypothetical protein E2I00_004007 [Balaenoptera physalus]
MKKSLEAPIKLNRTVALCIAVYQEDPDYLWECLQSVKRLTYPGIKVVMVIDGNSEDDLYMMDIFSEVMGRDKSATYIWKNNFHTKGPVGLIQQEYLHHAKMGWIREVMYTAFRALGRSVDYVQVCDSDTMLDPASTVEMVKVLEDPMVGDVRGDVQILNKYDSWITFLSSKGPVSLILDVSSALVDLWECTETPYCMNLWKTVLSLGYATKYTARSKCLTETPKGCLRWLNQQTGWSKSYFRE